LDIPKTALTLYSYIDRLPRGILTSFLVENSEDSNTIKQVVEGPQDFTTIEQIKTTDRRTATAQ
jgi:hypothetical protein